VRALPRETTTGLRDESWTVRYCCRVRRDRPDSPAVGRVRGFGREADLVRAPLTAAPRSGTAACSSPRRALKQRPSAKSQTKPMPRTPTRMTTAVITQPRTTRPSKTDVARPRWPSARFSSLLRAEPPPGAVQRAERLTPRIHLPRARRAPKVPPNHCGFPSAGPEPQSVHGQACTIDPTPAFGNDQGLRITLPAQTAHSGHLRRGGAEHEARGPRTTGDNASLAGKRAPAVGILDRSARERQPKRLSPRF
jgi:hypothetical protein